MTEVTSTASTFLELFGPERRRDPYRLYRELREHQPVYWDRLMRTWVVLEYADIARLAKDERLSAERIDSFYDALPEPSRTGLAPLARALSDMMVFADPPRHARLRGLVRPGLTPRFVRQIRAEIQTIAESTMDALAGRAEVDVIADFAKPLTRGLIARITGLADGAVHLLDDWQGLTHEFFTQSDAQVGRVAELRAVFMDGLADRRAGLANDLMGQAMAEQARSGDFTDAELFANFLLLIDAGQSTTTYMIGNAVRALLDRPDQLELLREHPELVGNAVHELMRFDNSVQYTTRIAAADLDVAGERIAAGQPVMLVLGSGNRDPKKYPDPDRLDLTRKATDNLSFGHGIHYCVGAALALSQVEIGLATLLRHTARLSAVDVEPEWLESINFRFLKRLPVAVEPAR